VWFYRVGLSVCQGNSMKGFRLTKTKLISGLEIADSALRSVTDVAFTDIRGANPHVPRLAISWDPELAIAKAKASWDHLADGSWIIHGYLWISMDIHGYPWISMDIHGKPNWLFFKFGMPFSIPASQITN
jgi:hypothetical protein